jgi:hypothetical protein
MEKPAEKTGQQALSRNAKASKARMKFMRASVFFHAKALRGIWN